MLNTRHWICCLAVITATIATTAFAADEKKPDAKKITYDEHVRPIFREKCLSCHNTDKKTAGLDLSNYLGTMEGGASGAVVEPGDAELSYLYMLVNHESEPYMPPKSEKMPADNLAVIAKWINGGALENSGSKAASSKPKVDLALAAAPSGKPEGPPPMPKDLSLAPVAPAKRPNSVTALATSPWAPLVAVAAPKQVLLYSTDNLKLLGVLPFPEGLPTVLKFSHNGQLLLAGGGRGGNRGLVVLWDITTGKRVAEVGDELDSVLAADISPDQRLVALGGPQRIVRVYSLADGQKLYEIRKHTEWITALAFSPDNVLLATADRNGGLLLWEAATGREYLRLDAHKEMVTGLSWRTDSNLLASASEEGRIRLWEMENGNQVRNWNAHGGGVESVEFTRDGRLVTCGRDRLAKLWDAAGKQQRAFEAFPDIALSVTYCDETGRVIAGDWTGLIRVWDSKDGKRIGELSPNPPAQPTAKK